MLIYLIHNRRFIALLNALLVVILPLVILPGLKGSTNQSQFFLFSYFIEVSLILYAFYLIKTKQLIFKISILDLLLPILLLFVTLNRYFIQNTYGFSLKFYEFAGLLAWYFLVRQLKLNGVKYLFYGIIISGIIQAVIGNLQLYGLSASNNSLFKITGSFQNPGPYAGYLSLILPIGVGLYLINDKKRKISKSSSLITEQKIFALAIVSILVTLPATHSRAAWIAGAISVAFILFKKFEDEIKVQLLKTGNIFKVLVLLITLFFTIGLSLYALRPNSANGRFLIWKVTANIFKDHSWFGNGIGGFKKDYSKYQADYFKNSSNKSEIDRADNVANAFNEPLEFLSENGIVGFSVLIIIIGFCLFTNDSNLNIDLSSVAKAGLLSLIIFSFFSYPWEILPIKTIAIFLIGILGTSSNGLITIDVNKFNGNYTPKWIFAPLIISLSCFFVWQTSILFTSFKKWNHATLDFQANLFAVSLPEYASVYSTFYNNGDFLIEYGKALNMTGNYKHANYILKRCKLFMNNTIIECSLGDSYRGMKNFKLAENSYLQAYYMAPNRLYPKYLLAQLYLETDQQQKLIKTATEILKKNAKVESVAVDMMRDEMQDLLLKYKKN